MALGQIPGVAATPAPRLREPFTLGIASGDPRPDGIVLWTRLAPEPLAGNGGMVALPYEVEWEMALDPAMQSVVRRGRKLATPELAHSVHVEVEGLETGRDYYYRFRVDGNLTAIGRTRTLPDPTSQGTDARIAMASCQHFQTGYYTAYKSLAAGHPDFVLFLGDYIYEYGRGRGQVPERAHVDPPEPLDLEGYRIRWAQYKLDQDLQNAHATSPFVTIWDDHEVKNDYAGNIPQPADTPNFSQRRTEAYQVFYENLPMRRRGPFDALRIYHRFRLGRLAEFSLLDTRQYRSDQPCDDGGFGNLRIDETCTERDDPNRTMLGATQRDWLLDGLRRSDTRWNFVVQQALFAEVDYNPDPALAEWEADGWDGYTADRRRILNAIQQRGKGDTVVLSGDIHSHLIADLHADPADAGQPPTSTELVVAGISSPSFGTAEEIDRTQNPHVKRVSDTNGYIMLRIEQDEIMAEVRGMENLVTGTRGKYVGPESTPYVDSRWVIEHGKPGATPDR